MPPLNPRPRMHLFYSFPLAALPPSPWACLLFYLPYLLRLPITAAAAEAVFNTSEI